MRTMLKGGIVPSFLLLAALVCTSSCTTVRHSSPLEGWKGGTTAYEGCPYGKAIIDDYRNYIEKLPRKERYYVSDFDIRFFEDGTGQHAVQISIPLNGVWREHVLIYDKDNKRIKVIKYASGRYAS